ncbi:hypothetical protein EVAR_96457_1 [Eumeta japonica]|uniref:Uncharacterized protein n=1 Tax=Eumeta variegata TaxID=151549 RepID=A0A4C1VWK5_EUMVA|nr:hypothetical protein EVAR_96457_1 [Eumeta japonica]
MVYLAEGSLKLIDNIYNSRSSDTSRNITAESFRHGLPGRSSKSFASLSPACSDTAFLSLHSQQIGRDFLPARAHPPTERADVSQPAANLRTMDKRSHLSESVDCHYAVDFTGLGSLTGRAKYFPVHHHDFNSRLVSR